MQQNDKSYTFLLSHSSRSRIFIKRVEVSKGLLHFGALGIFLTLVLSGFGFGVAGVVRSSMFARTMVESPIITQVSASTVRETQEYAKTTATDAYAVNSGGPDDESDQPNGENTELENQLSAIRAKADPAYLPTMWAHLGKINNEFGFRPNPFGGRAYEFHPGMDINGERGDQVIAPANGTVIKAGWTGGYGNMVEIDHGNGLTSRYGHMSKIEIEVGQTITRGELIGLIGSTGRSTGPHLHFELRLNNNPINPRHFLPPEPTDLNTIIK